MSAQPVPYLTPEQYTEIENKAEYKSEYYDGVMWPLGGEPFGMAGGRADHSLIGMNIGRELGLALKGKCLVYGSDMRIRTQPDGLYTYADVAVVCGAPELADDGMLLLNPCVIVEVLSRTTEASDRGFKFAQYRKITTLNEYALISQSAPCVEIFRRSNGMDWTLQKYIGSDASALFESVGCSIALADIYLGVKFGV